MTKLLEKAFAEAAKLPQEAQDSLARFLLEELASEQKWDQVFTGSAEMLSELAAAALAEDSAGRTTELDPDDL